MNTPAHALINLLVLTRHPNHRNTSVIIAGAIIPDMIIILFYGWHKFLGTHEQQIWSVEYFNPLWQAWIDSFNSIPLILIAMLVCWKMHKPLMLIFFASMLLHTFGDLPLHHDDAHRHFFPFSDWRFASPISYWNPAYHGNWASLIEVLCVVAASIYLYLRHPKLKAWVVSGVLIYLAYWIYLLLVWV